MMSVYLSSWKANVHLLTGSVPGRFPCDLPKSSQVRSFGDPIPCKGEISAKPSSYIFNFSFYVSWLTCIFELWLPLNKQVALAASDSTELSSCEMVCMQRAGSIGLDRLTLEMLPRSRNKKRNHDNITNCKDTVANGCGTFIPKGVGLSVRDT